MSRFTPNRYFQSHLLHFSGVRDPSPFRLLENVDDMNNQIVFPFLVARLIKCPSCLRKRVCVPSLFQRTALTFEESPLCTPVYRFLFGSGARRPKSSPAGSVWEWTLTPPTHTHTRLFLESPSSPTAAAVFAECGVGTEAHMGIIMIQCLHLPSHVQIGIV